MAEYVNDNGRRRGLLARLYFEGYTEKDVTGEDGKPRIERVYTGDYYVSALSDEQRRVRRNVNIGLLAFTVLLMLLAFSQDSRCSMTWYVFAPIIAAAAALMLLISSLSNQYTGPRRMTMWDYRIGPKYVSLYSWIAVGTLCAAAAAYLIYMLLHLGENPEYQGFAIVCCLISAACVFVIGYLERRTEYDLEPSDEDED